MDPITLALLALGGFVVVSGIAKNAPGKGSSFTNIAPPKSKVGLRQLAPQTVALDGVNVSAADLATITAAIAGAKERFYAVMLIYFEQKTASWAQNQAILGSIATICQGVAQVVAAVVTENVAVAASGIATIVGGSLSAAKACDASGFSKSPITTPPFDLAYWNPLYGGAENPSGAKFPAGGLQASAAQPGNPYLFVLNGVPALMTAMSQKYLVPAGSGVFAAVPPMEETYEYCRKAYLESAQGQADWIQFLANLAGASYPATFGLASNTATVNQNALSSSDLEGNDTYYSAPILPVPTINLFASGSSAAQQAAETEAYEEVEGVNGAQPGVPPATSMNETPELVAGNRNLVASGDAVAQPIPGLNIDQTEALVVWQGAVSQYWG